MFSLQPATEQWLEYSGIRVYQAALDFVLTMKVISGNYQDIQDIKSTQDAMMSLLKQYVREEDIPADVRRQIRLRFK